MRGLPYAAYASALVLVWPLLWPTLMLGDHFTFWYAGHLVAAGASPYDTEAWRVAATAYGPEPGGVAVNIVDGMDDARLPFVFRYPPWTALAASAAVAAAFAYRRAAPGRRLVVGIAAALALSLVLTPHLNTYDHLLLAPLAFLTIDALRGRPVALAAYAGGAVAVPWVLATAIDVARGSQAASAILPIAALAIAALSLGGRRHDVDDAVVSRPKLEVPDAR